MSIDFVWPSKPALNDNLLSEAILKKVEIRQKYLAKVSFYSQLPIFQMEFELIELLAI